MKIGIIKERKVPSDSRVPLTPQQCQHILANTSFDLVVERSDVRCYGDAEYEACNVPLVDSVSDCDILMGVKEVPIDALIPNKTYLYFSHTIKKQSYNRKLLQAMLSKNIRMIDYEVLTDEQGKRVIAFGRFAGMVGAHNGVMAYGTRTGEFTLPRMNSFHDYAEAKSFYASMKLPAIRIVLTGTGRVGNGAAEVLRDMGIREVSPEDYLNASYDEAVFVQLHSSHYIRHKDGRPFVSQHFYDNPKEYTADFAQFTHRSDIMINGIYWDNDAPVFFTQDEMKTDEFAIQVIADVTCDIAPVSSIPSTLKASTIADPVFGYNPQTGEEDLPYQPDVVDVMSIDNLPNELPRDASEAFGNMFIEHVLNEFLEENSDRLRRGSLTTLDGALTDEFEYLTDYVAGRE